MFFFSFISNKPHKKNMEIYVIDPNTKLAAVYYNREKKYPIYSGFALMSGSLGWRISWIKSTVKLNTKTQGGWMVLTIDVHRPTQHEVCSSVGWSSGTTTMWEPCSRYLVSTILTDRSSWTLLWSDLLKKSLRRPTNYEEIRALLEKPDEEIS